MFKYQYDANELTSFFNMISTFNQEATIHAKEGVLSTMVVDLSTTMMMWSSLQAKRFEPEPLDTDIFVMNVEEVLSYLKSFKGEVTVEFKENIFSLSSESKSASIHTLGERPISSKTPPVSEVVIVHLEEGEFKDYISSYAPLVKKFDAISFTTNTEGVSIEGVSEYKKGDLVVKIPKTKVEKSVVGQVGTYSIEFLLDIVKNMPKGKTSFYFQKDFPIHIHTTSSDGAHNMRIWIAPRISDDLDE